MNANDYGTLRVWMTYPTLVRRGGEMKVDYVKRVVAQYFTDREDAQRLVNEHAAIVERDVTFSYEFTVAPVEMRPEARDVKLATKRSTAGVEHA